MEFDVIHASNPDPIWKNNRGMDWGDWMSAGPATPKEIGATAFFAHSADLVTRMAKALGRPAEEEQYRTLFENTRQAFVKRYVSADGIIRMDPGNAGGQPDPGDTQGSYALALQFGLLDEPLKSKAAARLLQLVVKNGHHPTTGFWSSVELALSLSANGFNDEAARMMNQNTMPSWGYMAEHGTTFWEAFNANTRNLSLNHWTHSAITEWFWRNVAGLNPDEQAPGYQTFTLHPRPTKEVSWCRASYNSIRGTIVSNWRCEGNKITLEATIPANTTATVCVHATGSGAVSASGIPAAQAEGVTLIRTEPDTVVYQVSSGTYRFTSNFTLE